MGLIGQKSENKTVVDIVDRIFDKGIVVDPETRLSLMDTRLQPPGTRVVALLDTHREAA
jgi:hypothetical protein